MLQDNSIPNQLLYQADASKLEFDAIIQDKIVFPLGKFGVVLDQTYFYPTGGGQEHDTGTLGEARVIDVYKDEGPNLRLIHVVDRDLPSNKVHAIIESDRRLRHMQHHTAQHLLTHCFIDILNAETASANIKGSSPSTLDLMINELTQFDLEKVENLANLIIYENRNVKAYFIHPAEIQDVPLRKPPVVKENIRIIEIDGLDYSACAGTHVSKTGSIGQIKITKTEHVNDKLRVHFIAGWQALEVFRNYFNTFNKLATQASVSPLELPNTYQRLNDQLTTKQKELQYLRLQQINWEASSLIQNSQVTGSHRFVRVAFKNRPNQEMRSLADEFCHHVDTISLLINMIDDQKVSIIITCHKNSGFSAQHLLHQLLKTISGRGGGDSEIAQGGGTATEDQIKALITLATDLIEKKISL